MRTRHEQKKAEQRRTAGASGVKRAAETAAKVVDVPVAGQVPAFDQVRFEREFLANEVSGLFRTLGDAGMVLQGRILAGQDFGDVLAGIDATLGQVHAILAGLHGMRRQSRFNDLLARARNASLPPGGANPAPAADGNAANAALPVGSAGGGKRGH